MIGIRVDNNAIIGSGHLFRCMSIARVIQTFDEELLFICSSDSETGYIKQLGFSYELVENSVYNRWCLANEVDLLKKNQITVLLVDTYYVDKSLISFLHKYVKLIYIDDFKNSDFDVDVIINYNIESKPSDYSNILFPNREVYTGVEFFPLRSGLKTNKVKSINERVYHVLISSGATDPLKCVDSILGQISVADYPDISFYILLGLFYEEEYKNKLIRKYKEYNNVFVLKWGSNLKDVYEKIDILIAPGATMVYEALSSGVPCITYKFAENQHGECMSLNEFDIAPFAGDYSADNHEYDIKRIFEKELEYDTRNKQYKKFVDLFDGMGASRIADIVIKMK